MIPLCEHAFGERLLAPVAYREGHAQLVLEERDVVKESGK